MGVEPTRTGFADRCLSRSTITPQVETVYNITRLPEMSTALGEKKAKKCKIVRHQPNIANSSGVSSRTEPQGSDSSSFKSPIATRFRNTTFFPTRSHIRLT